jgi:hypothetical protein
MVGGWYVMLIIAVIVGTPPLPPLLLPSQPHRETERNTHTRRFVNPPPPRKYIIYIHIYTHSCVYPHQITYTYDMRTNVLAPFLGLEGQQRLFLKIVWSLQGSIRRVCYVMLAHPGEGLRNK